jgi:protein-(glutamine-N5) methyltransferase, release factor-specific
MTSLADAFSLYPLPLREQRLLMQSITGDSMTTLVGFTERPVDPTALNHFQQLCQRRLDGEPIAYLTGYREFYGLSFAVDPRVLIPRPETEGLVDWALTLGPAQGPWRVLELGTGSGAIAITLKHQRPAWQITATDRSVDALALARHNATRLVDDRLIWHSGSWFSALTEETPPFDLIIANPPYIDPLSPYLHQGDLRFEPMTALVADHHGMADLQHLIQQAPAHLVRGGHLLLEHGHDQGQSCHTAMSQAGFTATTRQDLAGLDRLTGGVFQ